MTLALRERRPIEVYRDAEYINLYHVFCRMQKTDETLKGLTLVRKKVGESKWWVFPIER